MRILGPFNLAQKGVPSPGTCQEKKVKHKSRVYHVNLNARKGMT